MVLRLRFSFSYRHLHPGFLGGKDDYGAAVIKEKRKR
jgi:hypothetical protein